MRVMLLGLFFVVLNLPVLAVAEEADLKQEVEDDILGSTGSTSNEMMKETLDQRQQFIQEMENKQKQYLQNLLKGAADITEKASDAVDSGVVKISGSGGGTSGTTSARRSMFDSSSKNNNNLGLSAKPSMFSRSNTYSNFLGSSNGNFSKYNGNSTTLEK